MDPAQLIDAVVKLVALSIDTVENIVNASAAHTAEERAAMVADLKLRLGVKVEAVGAVKFKDV